jgi:alkylhydroperoxidase/carboxymuconolactone decarboxylase family protein YurZ
MKRRAKTRQSSAPITKASTVGHFESVLEELSEWDPDWTKKYLKMSTNPWKNGILPIKLVELISLGLNVTCTNLQSTATRQHVRAALAAGATREEIICILKCASLLAIHSCSLGAPILLDEAEAMGAKPAKREGKEATPAVDQVRAIGQWNEAWNPFFQLDPVWTDEFMAAGSDVYVGKVFSSKDLELISVAFDACITHMYAPGVRRHIKAALKAGATMEEIMEVLKICVAQGIYASMLGVLILAEELKRQPTARKK